MSVYVPLTKKDAFSAGHYWNASLVLQCWNGWAPLFLSGLHMFLRSVNLLLLCTKTYSKCKLSGHGALDQPHHCLFLNPSSGICFYFICEYKIQTLCATWYCFLFLVSSLWSVLNKWSYREVSLTWTYCSEIQLLFSEYCPPWASAPSFWVWFIILYGLNKHYTHNWIQQLTVELKDFSVAELIANCLSADHCCCSAVSRDQQKTCLYPVDNNIICLCLWPRMSEALCQEERLQFIAVSQRTQHEHTHHTPNIFWFLFSPSPIWVRDFH